PTAEALAQQLAAGKPTKPKQQVTKRQAHFDDLAERLGDRLNTRVKIAVGARKSSVTIDFANGDDLNRILGELGIRDITE
ncbi:MAG: chromosome partitioning protein ParB, partial [Curtobacterium sp.]